MCFGSLIEMTLNQIKDCNLFLSSLDQLLYNPSSKESTSTDDEERFLSRRRSSHVL
jgi:hypothetical protein